MTVYQETPATARATQRPTASRQAGGPGGGGRGHDGSSGNGSPSRQTRERRTRVVIVGVLVVCLVAAALTRHWAMAMQERAASIGQVGGAAAGAQAIAPGGASLGSMDSFSLALLLGGLRGPLVMVLWTEIESRKNDRELEDVDTMIEMVRLLQPEFDTVHIFQSWNKAYNISAQVASLPNKYSVILDALQYLQRVDEGRPNSINILQSLSQIYNHKLGTTPGDSIYYRRRIREDSKWRPPSQREVRREGVPPRHHHPVLDPAGNLLPEFVTPKNAPPPGASRSRDWYDGSDLQYLRKYEPFPYGVSPLALGYNYAKRAQVLMNITRQTPKQLSEAVVDSRPALMLKEWSEEEWIRGRELEMQALGVPVPPPAQREKFVLEMPTANVPLDRPLEGPESEQAKQLREAIFSYEMTARLSADSRAEYARHLSNTENYINQSQNFQSHIDTNMAQGHLAAADAAYLRAMALPPGSNRNSAIRESFESYRSAVIWYEYMDLRYFTPPKALPDDVTREHLPALRDQELSEANSQRPGAQPLSDLFAEVNERLKTYQGMDLNQQERSEYAPYPARARQRAQLLLNAARSAGAAGGAVVGGSGGAAPTSSPITQPSQ